MKLGRNRPTVPSPHPLLARYVQAGGDVLRPPDSCDYSAAALPCLTDILGNDILGNCTAAEYAHQVAVWTANAGVLVYPSLDDVIQFYSQCSGYIPGLDATDQGADELVVLNVAKSVGIGGHRTLGAVQVNAADAHELALAIWLFGGVEFCAELPNEWLGVSAGFTWGVAGDPNPRQGHCWLGMGYDSIGVIVDTWGKVSEVTPSRLTWAAAAKYCVPSAGGSCYAMLSADWISSQLQVAPNGLDLATLLKDASAIGVVV